MDEQIKAEIVLKAIKERKWLEISYNNKEKVSRFWIGIKRIYPDRKMIVDIYNTGKTDVLSDCTIFYDRIQDAYIVENTFSETDPKLIKLIESSNNKFDFLNHKTDINNLLSYIKQCVNHDNDPSINAFQMTEGIDAEVLLNKKSISLNETQQNQIMGLILEYHKGAKSGKSSFDLGLSSIAIERQDKIYIIAYYPLRYSLKSGKLSICDSLVLNPFFTNEGTHISLQDYVDMDLREFEALVKKDSNQACEILNANKKRGDNISTRPNIFVQQFDITAKVNRQLIVILEDYLNGRLKPPMKAFLGSLSLNEFNNNIIKKEPPLCFVNGSLNIDQARVTRAALINPVTYVQGPPGTGKTSTIVNIIFSAFLSNTTVLVSSSNNIPINGIADKLFFRIDDQKLGLPFLRLGNFEEDKKAILKIKQIYKELSSQSNSTPSETISEEEVFSINQELSKRLKSEEQKRKLEEKVNTAREVFNRDDIKLKKSLKKINHCITMLDEISSETEPLTDKEVKELVTPISESVVMQRYLKQLCDKHLRLLLTKEYRELISIFFKNDLETQCKEFRSYISDNKKLQLLLKVFPIILTTNISCSNLGSGKPMFNLTIMDESSQCSIGPSLLPIARGERLLLVGDPNQLRPIILLSHAAEQEYRNTFDVSTTYNYIQNSIFDVMTANDCVSPRLMLRYHYRCGRKIIDYSNKRYYESMLKTEFSNKEGSLVFLDCKNTNVEARNSAYEEADAVVEYAKKHQDDDLMIVTPFVNQSSLINQMLQEKGVDTSRIKCGTIHSLQGSEKANIVFSLGLSYKTAQRTYEWLKNNRELINVGVTRAKDKLIIAGDSDIINALSDKTDDLYYLVNYVKNNGTKVDVPPAKKVEIGLSNGSKAEDEFYKTMSQFCSVHRKFVIKRNVLVSELFKDDPVLSSSRQEFDAVLYEKVFLFAPKPKIVFEIDGGEHIFDEKRIKADDKKLQICNNKGIKLIRIPNEYVMRYTEIIEVMKSAFPKS